jgi:hexosaminidase
VGPTPGAAPGIELGLDPAIASAEGYRLTVAPDRVRVIARGAAGLFYGLQTLRQLLPAGIEPGTAPAAGPLSIPAVTIETRPRFAYRGLMLDVSRHFFPVEFIEKLIDLAALYKLNRFHWHLTDDQGWRLEIKKYPRLTEVGAFRDEGGTRVGGSYTQEQVRALVRYAAERFVTIVPEIELPGHCTAALAAYPEFACTPGPFVIPSAKGIYDGVFCPSEATFSFLDDLLGEVAGLFPGQLLHLGGDEVKPGVWKASPVAQAVMAREGLRDATALEGYFMRRLTERARALGREVIGWDEILDAGEVPPDATVMSWRDDQATVRAVQGGHDTILTPRPSATSSTTRPIRRASPRPAATS